MWGKRAFSPAKYASPNFISDLLYNLGVLVLSEADRETFTSYRSSTQWYRNAKTPQKPAKIDLRVVNCQYEWIFDLENPNDPPRIGPGMSWNAPSQAQAEEVPELEHPTAGQSFNLVEPDDTSGEPVTTEPFAASKNFPVICERPRQLWRSNHCCSCAAW